MNTEKFYYINLQSIVMRTSLSKSEFASALGMKADAVFVKKMFNIVDKDSDGRISFQVGKSFDKGFSHCIIF